MANAERRQAAIMFNEIVDYAELVQKDLPHAELLLEKYREILRQNASNHKGREIRSIGDEPERTGLRDWVAGPHSKGRAPKLQPGESMVEFENSLDAALCAIDIQRELHEYNSGVPRHREILLRIGLHLGEVVKQQNDAFGDAVNIASRIEPLAEPGGICLTEQVHNQIRHRTELHVTKLGPMEMKGVELPVGVYKIAPSWKRNEPKSIDQSESGRVAVLPFTNISAEPADEYFADGLTEELISTMSKINELSVISRTSVMQYKNKSKPIKEIGRELDAGTILEGSVRRAGNRVRISIQMIDATRDKHLWAENYDREIQDIFAIQSDIAQRVAEALRVQLLASEKKDIERRPTENTEAYQLYLKGRYYWNERTKDGTDKAVRYFDEAAKLDPKFALAYAGLADCYVLYGNYVLLRPGEAWPRAKEYAMKAIEIDPRLAEPHASLGAVYTHYEWKWQEAEKEFKQAIELKPSYATAHQWYQLFLLFMGRVNEGYDQIKRASELDPLSRVIGLNLASTLMFMGKLREAIEHYERVTAENPDYAYIHSWLGVAYYLQSRMNEAFHELKRGVDLSPHDNTLKAHLAFFLAVAGRRDEAEKLLDEMKELARTTYVSSAEIALVLLGLGKTNEAFSYLDKAYDERSDRLLYFRVWQWLSEARKDPRWASLEKRLGLPEN